MVFPAVRRRLPDAVVGRARRYLEGGFEAAAPRDAATVVLLRDVPGAPGVEVYLLRRVASMAFAGGMYAFPGGSVDERDSDPEVAWSGPSPESWARSLAVDVPLARALVCAAVRETFEESGVLLAGPDEEVVVPGTRGREWDALREALLDHTLSLGQLLGRQGLVLRTGLIRPWAHWITPEFEPRRFDTHFFVAALPAGQRTREVSGEADRVAWMNVRKACRAYGEGDLAMMAPTAATIAELAEFDSVASVLAHADGVPERRLPTVTVQDSRAYLVLPGDSGDAPGAPAGEVS